MVEVDGIYCINVQGYDTRYKHTLKELQNLGWENQTIFYRPEKHPLDGHIGCYESHRAIIKKARELQQTYVLILEDDFFMNGPINHQHIQRFKTLQENADIYFLGHRPWFMWPVSLDGFFRCWSFQTHAYIINIKGPMAQFLVETPYAGIHIDILYCQKAKCYATLPSVAFQRLEPSTMNYPSWTQQIKFFFQHPQTVAHMHESICAVFCPLLVLIIAFIFVFLLIARKS